MTEAEKKREKIKKKMKEAEKKRGYERSREEEIT
jgi:hypothetical protein